MSTEKKVVALKLSNLAPPLINKTPKSINQHLSFYVFGHIITNLANNRKKKKKKERENGNTFFFLGRMETNYDS